MTSQRAAPGDVTIRPLREEEIPTATRVLRRAFGTFMNMPDPEMFAAESDILGTLWRANPARVFAAEYDGALVGSNVASNWGSIGFFGPLTVSPELWDKGIGGTLVEAAMEQFTAWGNEHRGLFTFANSPKHIHLYEKFGFHARYLTPIMAKDIAPRTQPTASWLAYSTLEEGQRAEALTACHMLTDAVYDGLDVGCEIESVQAQSLGETVLLHDGSRLKGFAVCHCGAGSQAEADECYVKFGTVWPGAIAGEEFAELLNACEEYATSRGVGHMSAGINMGCDEAYRVMRACGYRTGFLGVAMQQPNEAGYHRSDCYVISDWR